MRKLVVFVGFVLTLMSTGCVAVTARDNQLHFDRRHDVAVVGNRVFLVNLQTGHMTEMRVPGVGETTPVSELPPEERECEQKPHKSAD